jgi:hypothetical protein
VTPFRWSQFGSTNDYRTFVANLRAADCPDTTIRAIVMVDTETAFALKRQQLGLSENTSGRFSMNRARQVAATLLNEPVNLTTGVTSVTAPENNSETPMAPTTAAATFRSTPQNTATLASYPLTLQEPVQNDPALNNNQKAAVRQIQQQFEDAIGGPNQNPSDPAYAARWQTAQHDADDALRAALGNQAYQGYQLQHYYSNFQNVMLNAGDSPVTIDPSALAK